MRAVFACSRHKRNLVRGTQPTTSVMRRGAAGCALPVLRFLLLLPFFTLIPPVQADTTITINNVDPARVGFNDQTSVVPIGGNAGVTLGEQRLRVLEFAADVWASILDSSVEIVVQATFSPLPCDMTSAVLGAAGPIRLFANFPSDVEQRQADVWYPAALSNALAVQDLSPGPADAELLHEPYNDDIVAFFNGDIDGNPNCLPGDWYYGFDTPAPKGTISLLNVVMHELAHGVGLVNVIDPDTGAPPLDLPDVHSTAVYDTSLSKHWHEMDNDERLISQLNQGSLVWDGEAVTEAAPDFLDFQAELEILSPSGLKGQYAVRLANFGPTLALDAESESIELANDRIGDPTDACEPLKNRLRGDIALVSRGHCPFTLKVAHAQAAGASAVLVVNDAPGDPIVMDGDGAGISIPAISVGQEVGNALMDELTNSRGSAVKAALRVNPDQLVGADEHGRVLLYAPPMLELGSSISHWDPSATPDLLMEPFLNSDIDAASEVDLTRFQLQDIGWIILDESQETDEEGQE